MTDDGREADPDPGGPEAPRPVLFEEFPDPAARVEPVEGEQMVRAVNAAFERVFGHDADAIRGEALSAVVVPADGEAAGTPPGDGRSGSEVQRLIADGEAREFLCRSIPADDDSEYVVYTDVTARRRREATLRGLHEATRELVASEDRAAVASRIVEACREVLGFRYASVRYHDPETDRLVPAEVSEAGREVFDDPPAFDRGESLAWEVLDRGEPALYGDISEHDAAITDEIGVRSLLVLPVGDHGTLNVAADETDAFDEADISTARILAANAGTALDRLARERELRERERDLRRQNERLDEFASVVSHDLRNPLSVAEARLSTARTTADDETASHLERATGALVRMERLIDDLLDLARKGQAVGETRPVDIGEAARQAWRNVSTGTATLSVATGGTVEADPERLRTVFENLFRNCIEHADDGVSVEVGTFRHGGATGVYVADDGPGVPPADRNRVFASGHSPEDGTGIGLAVVRRVAEAHGWTAELVESDAGGARVELRDVGIVTDETRGERDDETSGEGRDRDRSERSGAAGAENGPA